MIRKLVLHTDKILREPCKEVAFNDRDIPQDVLDSFDAKSMVGLSAPQIGLPYRCSVCLFDTGIEVIINPVLEVQGEEQIVSTERCVSFPNVLCKIKRASTIKLSYYNNKWERCEKILTGYNAIVAQHECDHLDGIVMMDKAFYKTYKKR